MMFLLIRDDESSVSAVGAVTPVPAEMVSLSACYHSTNPLVASQTDTMRAGEHSTSPFVDSMETFPFL